MHYIDAGLIILAGAVPLVLGIEKWWLWTVTAIVAWVILTVLASVYVKVFFPPSLVRYNGPPITDHIKEADLPLNPWRKL